MARTFLGPCIVDSHIQSELSGSNIFGSLHCGQPHTIGTQWLEHFWVLALWTATYNRNSVARTFLGPCIVDSHIQSELSGSNIFGSLHCGQPHTIGTQWLEHFWVLALWTATYNRNSVARTFLGPCIVDSHIQSELSGSNIFGSMKVCSRYGYFEPLCARSGDKWE